MNEEKEESILVQTVKGIFALAVIIGGLACVPFVLIYMGKYMEWANQITN